MSELNREQMEAALETLRQRFSDPNLLCDPISTDGASLTAFLEKTDDIALDRNDRLISLATYLESELSWSQLCEIFERALQETDNPMGTLAVWSTAAERLISNADRSESERNEIAGGLVQILDRALQNNPENSGYALMMGMHYFREAMRQAEAARKADLIEQSRVWLNRVIGWAGESDAQCCAYAVLYLGHCHTALEEFQRAMMRYNGVSVELLTNDEREIQGLAEGITLCKRALEVN